MKKILSILVSFFFLVQGNFAATYYTTATGDWLTTAKWSTNTAGPGSLFSTIEPLLAASGDTLYIDDYTSINSAEVNLEAYDLVIVLAAQLDVAKKLRLSENSEIIFEDGGFLNPTGPGNSEKISFGGTNVWTGNDGPIPGPGTMDKTFDPATGLPIELTSFTAKLAFDDVKLNWKTAKEENFSHFEVERTTDNENYEAIGFVQGVGESLADVYYDFVDNNAPYGVVYYRLKSVDKDGSFDYSWIISIKKSLEGKINVSPNPASTSDRVKITLPTEFSGVIAKVSIYDINGMMVQESFDVDGTQALEINKNLIAGMYIIKVQHNGLEENMRLIVR